MKRLTLDCGVEVTHRVDSGPLHVLTINDPLIDVIDYEGHPVHLRKVKVCISSDVLPKVITFLQKARVVGEAMPKCEDAGLSLIGCGAEVVHSIAGGFLVPIHRLHITNRMEEVNARAKAGVTISGEGNTPRIKEAEIMINSSSLSDVITFLQNIQAEWGALQ